LCDAKEHTTCATELKHISEQEEFKHICLKNIHIALNAAVSIIEIY